MNRWVAAAVAAAIAQSCPAHAQEAEDAEPNAPAEPSPPSEGVRDDAPPETPGRDAVEGADVTEEADRGDEPGTDALESLLDERVVTTASRSAETTSAAPALVTTIGGDELRRFGVRTLDEALSFLGLGVFAQDTGADLYTELDVGASGVVLHNNGRHVLLLLDGHVMNSQTTGDAFFGVPLGVPLEAIDHVEVMLGPGSVVYGSNAMLAVVNVVTRAPRTTGSWFVSELSVGVPTGVGGRIHAPGDAHHFGFRQRVGLRTEGGLGDASSPVGRYAIAMDFQGESSATYTLPELTDSDFYEIEPGSSFGGVFSHTMRAPSGHATFEFGDFRLALQANAYFRSVPWSGIPRTPRTSNRSQSLRFDFSHHADPSERVGLRTRVYGDVTRFDQRSSWLHDYWCLPGQIYGCDYRHANAARWIGAEEQVSVHFGLAGRSMLMVGGDLRLRSAVGRPADYFDRVTHQTAPYVEIPYYAKVSVLGALFAQYTLNVDDWFSMNVGARFDADSLFGVRPSPRAAFAFDVTDRTTIRVGYSEAFRAPSADELYATDPTYYVAPTNLDAEVARSLDLEWRQRFERGDLSLRGYGALYENFINSRLVTMGEFDAAYAAGQLSPNADAAYVLVVDNLDRIFSLGATLAANLRPVRGLEVAFNGTVSRAALLKSGFRVLAASRDERLPILPDAYGNARIAYTLDGGTSFAFVSTWSSRIRPYGAIEYLPPGVEYHASPRADMRATVSGALGERGLRYRVGGSFSVNPFAPYLSGFGPTATAPDDAFALTPLGRGYFFVALEHRPDAP